MGPRELLCGLLLLLGAFFALTGAVGVLRMPDFYTRVHPAGKVDTFAQTLILGGLLLVAESPLVGVRLALIWGLLLVTTPAAAHALVRAAHLDGREPWRAPDGAGAPGGGGAP